MKNFKFTKWIAASMVAMAISVNLTACGDDDENPTVKPDNTSDLSEILYENGTQIGNGEQEFEITGKFTLPKGVYTLKGWVYLAEGAELTIEPGTVIKGDKDTKATLIVEPGAKLYAEGSAAAPIVFTSAQPAGSRRPGDWGGLILCGKASNNQGTMTIEGGPRTTHGGDNDNDSSGVLSYVRVEFAGIPYATDQEINGITFGSVGKGTKIDHVQVSYSGDDSFEWFGGAVDCSHLVAFKGWDDDFDTDNGFSGHVQFCYSQRDPRIADQSVSNGFESDNCADAATKEPFTQCVFSNVTFVGPSCQDATFNNTSDYINAGGLNPNNGAKLGQFQAAMQVRRNSHLSCFNSVAVGFPVGIIIENDKGSTTQAVAADGTLKIANVYMAGMTILGSDKNKSFKNLFTDNSSDFDESRESFSAQYFKSVATNKVFDNVSDLMLSPSYMPMTGSPLLDAASFSDALLSGFRAVSYIGAFSGTSDDWMNSWTNFDPQNTVY